MTSAATHEIGDHGLGHSGVHAVVRHVVAAVCAPPEAISDRSPVPMSMPRCCEATGERKQFAQPGLDFSNVQVLLFGGHGRWRANTSLAGALTAISRWDTPSASINRVALESSARPFRARAWSHPHVCARQVEKVGRVCRNQKRGGPSPAHPTRRRRPDVRSPAGRSAVEPGTFAWDHETPRGSACRAGGSEGTNGCGFAAAAQIAVNGGRRSSAAAPKSSLRNARRRTHVRWHRTTSGADGPAPVPAHPRRQRPSRRRARSVRSRRSEGPVPRRVPGRPRQVGGGFPKPAAL